MPKQMGWRGLPNLYFAYVEGASTSTALGIDDTDSGKFKIQSLNAGGAQPTGTVQITIDPTTNGNITLNPNGIGAVVVTTDINMSNTNNTGTIGVINWAGNRFIHNIGTANVFVGNLSGNFLTSGGGENTAVGDLTLNSVTTSPSNSAFGNSCLKFLTSGIGNNTAIGHEALINLTTGNTNIALGHNTGFNYTGSESNNILINNVGTLGENNTIHIGNPGAQTKSYITGIYDQTTTADPGRVVIVDDFHQLAGITSGTAGQILTSNGSGSSPSFQAAPSSGASTFHTGSGDATASSGAITIAGTSNQISTTGSGSTVTIAIPSSPSLGGTVTAATGFTATTGSITATAGNVVITAGNLTLPTTSSTVGQIKINGTISLHSFGTNNFFAGASAGNTSLSGNENTGIGVSALGALTASPHNCAIGFAALESLTGGNGNNTALGHAAMYQLGTGDTNIAIGHFAGSGYTGAESNNVIINAVGTGGESGVMRIGNPGAQTACYISGIAGVTVANSAAVLLNTSTGQLGTIVSSKRYKENIRQLNDEDSSFVHKLKPVSFDYKDTGESSFGLIAEDVDLVMPELVIKNKEGLPETVKYHEFPAILINEIQKLNRRIEKLEKCKGVSCI